MNCLDECKTKLRYRCVSASKFMPENESVYVMSIVHEANVRIHVHDIYEFVFIKKGFAIHNTTHGMSVLLPGDAVLIKPNEPHSYFNVHAQKLYNCLFKIETFNGFEDFLPCSLNGFLNTLSRKIHITMDLREEVFRLLKSLTDETAGSLPGRNAKLKAQLIEVMLIAYRCQIKKEEADNRINTGNANTDIDIETYTDTGITTDNKKDTANDSDIDSDSDSDNKSDAGQTEGYISTGIVMKAINFLQKEFANEINMQDVAAECGVTPDYLAKLFRRACGIPPSEFLTSIRISAAMEFLMDMNIPISNVAEMVGYDDSAYFSRIFKKTVGTSPLAYRTGSFSLK